MSRYPAHPSSLLIGLEWNGTLHGAMNEVPGRCPLIKIVAEDFAGSAQGPFLRDLKERNIPTLVHTRHAVGRPVSQARWEDVLAVLAEVPARSLSAPLLPPGGLSRRTADELCRQLERLQSRIAVPLLIENVSDTREIAREELSEPEFLGLVLRRTGCGLLLDLTSLHVRALQGEFNPYEWLDAVPLDSVLTVQVTGVRPGGTARPVPKAVWDLYREVGKRIRPRYTIVVGGAEDVPFESLMADLHRARRILDETAMYHFDLRSFGAPYELPAEEAGGAA